MSQRIQASKGGLNKTRITGVATQQTIKSSPGYVHRIILSNITTAATLTISDGGTAFHVAQIGAPATLVIEIGAQFNTDIRVTPSATTIDALVVFD